MSKALKRIIPWVAGAAFAVSLSACSSPADEPTPMPDPLAPSASAQESPPAGAAEPDPSMEPVEPANPSGATGTEQSFDGESVTTDTITANQMEMKIPSGFRIPEDTLVTEATAASIMMADEDPAAVIAMVESSAAEAGYEKYAETATGTVYVGNGNAVLFDAGPQMQLITWGPEEMKDLLAGG